MTLTVVLGLTMVAALLTYFGFSLEKEHHVFRLLLFFFVFILLMIIPQAGLQSDCQVMVNSTDEIHVYGDNYTGYHWDYATSPPTCNPNDLDCVNLFHIKTEYTYETVCEEREDNAALNFFKTMLWLFRLFVTYVIMYMGWQAIQWLIESYKRGRT